MTNPYIEQIKELQSKPTTPQAPTDNPYTKQLQALSSQTEPSSSDNTNEGVDDSFTHTLGSFIDYLGDLPEKGTNILRGVPSVAGTQYDPETAAKLGESLQDMSNNFSKTAVSAYQYAKQNIATMNGGKVLDDFADLLNKASNSKGSLLSGMFKGIVEKPIEALTYTTNENGTAQPATPEQEAQSLQTMAGLVAQVGTFKALSSAFLGKLPATLDEAMQGVQATKLGPLALSPKIAQSAKFMAAETGAGAISGGVSGAISGMGQDNQAEQVVAGALSFAKFGAALSFLGMPKYIRDVAANRGKLIAESNNTTLPDLAALNALRVNPSDPMSTLVSNVDAVSSADKMVKAAINSKLKVGDGYIVEGISPEYGKTLEQGTNPSEATYPDNYVPPQLLNKATYRPKPFGTEVKFVSPFDKLAYFAAGNKISPDVQSMINDAINQTGLTQDEIAAHGKYIRLKAKLAAKTSPLIPRSQADIDSYNQESLDNGNAIISRLADGQSVKDSQGNTWTKIGDNITDGKITRPINEATTAQIIGRKANDSPFYQPYLQLDKQEFNPNFGRVANPNATVKYHYADNPGNLLVTPIQYKPEALNFFKKTGFMKNEIVSYNGVDYTVIDKGENTNQILIKNNNTGVSQYVDPSDVRRTNYSLTPDIIQGQGIKAPTLNPTSILNNLYSKMWNDYSSTLKEPEIDDATGALKETNEVPFGKFLEKFYSENRIPQKDQSYISSIFTKKLADDLANTTLSPEELSARQSMMSKFKGISDDYTNDYSHFLTNQAENNGLVYSPEGGGKYRIRAQDNGQTLGIVGSPDEAQTLINKIRQNRGLDQDGGFTGSVPPGIGNLGGLAGEYTPEDPNRIEARLDRSRMGKLASKFSPVSHVLQSADNVAHKFGLQTNFFPAFSDLQQTLFKRSNLTVADPQIGNIAKSIQSALDLGGSITSKRRIELADVQDAMNIDDIKNRMLSRPLNTLEDNMAQQLAKTDVGAVQQLLYDTKKANPNATVGGSAYLDALNQIGSKADPKVLDAAKLFSSSINKLGKDTFSGPAVLKLASAYENPGTALSKMELASKLNVTPKEQLYLDQIDNNFKSLADLMNIDPKARMQMYLPSIIKQYISGESSGPIPEGFTREMSKVGITPKNILLRDPNKLLTKYFSAALNEKSGFNEALGNFRDSIQKDIQQMSDKPELTSVAAAFGSKMDNYINQMRGFKSLDDNLWQSLTDVASHLGIKNFDTNSILNLASLGSIAGRPALAVRDLFNVFGMVYNHFGHELTNNVFSKSVSPEYVNSMKARNLLPDQSAERIIDPGADESTIMNTNKTIRQWASNGFNMSGQEFVYEHSTAAIYKGSMDMAEKYFKQLQDKKITKGQAFDKLGITSNYGNGLIQQINNHLLNGRPDLASNLYAEANMRLLSPIYGFHNNPIGWNTTFGRLMSQWGSWSANSSQAFMDLATRGSAKQIAAKVARMGINNAALVYAGRQMGFNLLSWTTDNPANVWPSTGPLIGVANTISDNYNQGQPLDKILWNESLGFVPYARAAHDWFQGMNMVGQGNMLTGLGRMTGAPIMSDQVPR